MIIRKLLHVIVVAASTASLLLDGCMSLSPIHDQPPIVQANGVVEYNNPRFENGVTWFGWLTVIGATAGGAYGGYRSDISLKWDDNGETVKPVGNAVLGGAVGFLGQLALTYIVGHRSTEMSMDRIDQWVYKLDDELTPIGAIPGPDGTVRSIRVIRPDAEQIFIIRDTADARLFKRIFPSSGHTGRALSQGMDSISRSQLPLIAELFPGEPASESARLEYVWRSQTIADATEAANRYPELRDTAARVATKFVRNLGDARAFDEAFPASEHRPALADRIAERLASGEYDAFAETFPDYHRMDVLRGRLLDSAQTVADVVALARRFPELATRAEAQAAKLSHSVREYREYLGQFPNGASASVVKSRLAEAMAKPENLGSNVNSYASELAPMISPDGRTLYYVRDGHAGNDGDGEDQDIWISSQDDLGDWLPAEHPGFPLNNTDPNGVLSVTPDGNSLLLNGGYDGANGFALSHRDSRGWSYPERIEVRNYYNLSHYIAAYLANDARTLLMSIERSDSRGERDLYVSFLGSGGQWSEPRSLGKTVNTSADEGSPFLASDGVTLFFSSYGHKGYGSSDVFVTRRLDNTWRKWSTPVNLGPAINTDDFENSFIIPAAGDYAYYTSSASGQGGEDIFRIAVPEFARPKAVVLVTGRVVDQKTGEPLSASIVYETLADGKEVGSARSDPKTGLYKIALPAGATYGFRAESDGYIAVSDNLDLSALRQYEERRADLVLVPMEVGQSVRLNNLFFDFGKATLRKESFSELGRLADVLRRNPNMAVEIAGHTDSVGTAERNQELSQQRANAVAMYLKGKGIGNERVTVAGYGATKPLAPNETEEGRQRNRRVEFVILRR